MSQLLSARTRLSTRLVIALTAALAIVIIAIFTGQRPGSNTRVPVGARTAARENSESKQLAGAPAREYIQETTEGQALMEAVTTARFELKPQDNDPISGKIGPGYLGMSHDENLNVWFGDEGATIRPTLSPKDHDKTWRLEMKLKAYGYGDQLTVAPPIISRQVNENRIEYRRRRNESTITEWYVNESAGIEQGLTLNERPARGDDISPTEPLRLVVAINGDLRARATEDGQTVELNRGGESVLSYSHLSATDAAGKKLAARMETNPEGNEIALVVNDAEAEYPVVVDPITTTLKQKLDAGPNRQLDARFGFAVAIDDLRAVVGAWREDLPGAPDAGRVYVFSRPSSSGSWTLTRRIGGDSRAGAACGSSVDVLYSLFSDGSSSTDIVYGCPGANNGVGRAFHNFDSASVPEFELLPISVAPGDTPRHGTSVSITHGHIMVGAPFYDFSGLTDNGAITVYDLGSTNVSSHRLFDPNPRTNDQFGASVAEERSRAEGVDRFLVVGEPGAFSNTGTAVVFTYSAQFADTERFLQYLQPDNADLGANFGNSVAVDRGYVVVGAPLDDNERGTDAGAAYVFVTDGAPSSRRLSQQQKLIPSNGRANDHFGEHAVAIEGRLIVVGANGHDRTVGSGFDTGAAYLFSRTGTVWTEETIFAPNEGFGATDANQFGVSVDISGNTVLVGARAAAATDGTGATGAAYSYSLDCVPPDGPSATIQYKGGFSRDQTVCFGNTANLLANYVYGGPHSIQWRKNGVDIPGANTFTYVLSNLNSADAAAYDFVLTSSCGSTISNVVTIRVYSYILNPSSGNFGAGGSDGVFTVSSSGGCNYTAVSNNSWITITSNATGTPPKNISFHVEASLSPQQRTGSITIGEQTFSISQDGINCSYSISPSSQNFSSAGGTNSVIVTATAGCAWNAASNDSWISVPPGSGGTGNGTLNYTVAANTGPQRTGTLTVAGQSFTVTQASGCTFSINPVSQNFTSAAGSNSATVTAGGGCAWTATSNSSFATITSGSSGSGNGAVNYSVSANGDTTQRTGSLTIAGQTLTVTQDGVVPTPTPTPTPTPNVVQFNSSTYSIQEDCTTVTIIVNRIGDTSAAAIVDYNTSDVTATERKDYITALGTLRFAPGETSKSFAILINEDSFVEGNETFSINLSNPSGASLGGPAIATITITDDSTELAANPIDDAGNYVCQHYHDFLNRQPDAPGLQFWTNQITSCGNDQACIEARRINVSASFFLSIEFQDTGYLVERIYKAAYGDASGNSTFPSAHQLPVPIVRLNEFLSDSQEIGQGVIVGQGNWQQQLENNKQALTAALVQRSRFTTAFPSSMTAAQFVDNLNANAGNPLSSAERDQLVSDLSTNARTRAQVLRAVAEDNDLNSAEFNRAFVLMQYFGYLRRNPNDPQDSDHTGYDFWLTKLNQFSGNYINAEMVKAFITSIEYRQRFGP